MITNRGRKCAAAPRWQKPAATWALSLIVVCLLETSGSASAASSSDDASCSVTFDNTATWNVQLEVRERVNPAPYAELYRTVIQEELAPGAEVDLGTDACCIAYRYRNVATPRFGTWIHKPACDEGDDSNWVGVNSFDFDNLDACREACARAVARPRPGPPRPGSVRATMARVLAERDSDADGPRFVPIPTGRIPDHPPSTVQLTASQRGSYPARAVVLLQRDLGSCFAVFTGPNELRTAGHCVLSKGDTRRVLSPAELEIRLWPEAAAQVGQRTAHVVAVETQPGWPHEPELSYLENEGVTLRIREPLGRNLGYFGLYRERAGSVGSLGGENLSTLCDYETRNAPILASEWRDPINYELAFAAGEYRPFLNYPLINRDGGRLASYACRIQNDWQRHPKDAAGEFRYDKFGSGLLDLRVSTCRFDYVRTLARFVSDPPCDSHSGDSGHPLFILEDGLPVLVGNLYGGGPDTASKVGRTTSADRFFRIMDEALGIDRQEPLSDEQVFPILDGRLPDVMRYPVTGSPEVVYRTAELLPLARESMKALWLADALYVAGDFPSSARAYELARELGHYRAPWALYAMHKEGLVEGADAEQMVSWLTESAGFGCPNAQAHLAAQYLVGEAIPQDIDKALDLLDRATAKQRGSQYPGAETPYAYFILGQLNKGYLTLAHDHEEEQRLLAIGRGRGEGLKHPSKGYPTCFAGGWPFWLGSENTLDSDIGIGLRTDDALKKKLVELLERWQSKRF